MLMLTICERCSSGCSFVAKAPPNNKRVNRCTIGSPDDPNRNSSSIPGQSHLHFHCAQRSVALPKQVFFAADQRRCTRIGAPEVTKSSNSGD
jgi:hypothetical protein